MSSCKVFKADASFAVPVRDFSFQHLNGVAVAGSVAVPSVDTFAPMFAVERKSRGFLPDYSHAPAVEECEPVVEELPPEEPLAGVTEAELAEQLDQAYSQGMVEGARQMEERFDSLFHAMTDAATSVIGVRDQIIRDSEEDLLRLAILIAKKIIHREVRTDRSILAGIVAEAMKSVSEKDQLVISLNPVDFDLVVENKNEYLPQLSERQSVTLKSDPSVGPSGCIVETELGSIDARIEAQLEEIANRLMDERTKVREPEARAPEER